MNISGHDTHEFRGVPGVRRAVVPRRKFSCCFVYGTALAVLGLASNTAWAGKPKKADGTRPVRKATAEALTSDPVEHEHRLLDSHGPWLIYAASFAGDGAERDAQRLAQELRQQHKLAAYIYQETFDFRQPVRGKGVDPRGKPLQMRYRQSGAFAEYAVLIGDFSSVDDPKAQKVLKKVKFLQPAALQPEKSAGKTQRFAGLRALQRRLSTDAQKRKKGPMGQAFITRNPLLPAEYFVPQGVDQWVMEMNEKRKYSLMDCGKKYSVRVATFRGNVVLDQREVEALENGKEMNSKLAQAGEKAERLTLLLRKKGVEAYQFHDRNESIVTVGSFETVGTLGADGRVAISPAVQSVVQMYGPRSQPLPGDPLKKMAGVMPRSMGGISFDIQPVAVLVPRRSMASDYANRESQ